MAGAFTPLEPQEQPNDVAGSNGVTSSDVVPSPPAGALLSTISAASIAVPASAGAAVILRGLLRALLLPWRALDLLPLAHCPSYSFQPTRSRRPPTRRWPSRSRPSWAADRGNRAACPQRLLRRIGAKWETLPVEAQQVVGGEGSAKTVINHEQLNRFLHGPHQSHRRPPVRPPRWRNPRKTGSRSNCHRLVGCPTADDCQQSLKGNVPATQSLAPSQDQREKRWKRQSSAIAEEERVLACRAVWAMARKEPARRRGIADGPGALDTRQMAFASRRAFPAPKVATNTGPTTCAIGTATKGELELKNRIEKAVPYEKFVHYGNPAGDQGADAVPDHWPRRVALHGMDFSVSLAGGGLGERHGQFRQPPFQTTQKSMCGTPSAPAPPSRSDCVWYERCLQGLNGGNYKRYPRRHRRGWLRRLFGDCCRTGIVFQRGHKEVKADVSSIRSSKQA